MRSIDATTLGILGNRDSFRRRLSCRLGRQNDLGQLKTNCPTKRVSAAQIVSQKNAYRIEALDVLGVGLYSTSGELLQYQHWSLKQDNIKHAPYAKLL